MLHVYWRSLHLSNWNSLVEKRCLRNWDHRICTSYLSRTHNPYRRWTSSTPAQVQNAQDSNLDVGHSRFLAEASSRDKWKHGIGNSAKGGEEGTADELDGVNEGHGKVLSTSSHLFKMILPLNSIRPKSNDESPPTVFLLHPSQPLSHVSRLISSSLSPDQAEISYRTASTNNSKKQRSVEWSDSTDIGDFIKDASRNSEFELIIQFDESSSSSSNANIIVTVPSFHQRTKYLRRRLHALERNLTDMESLNRQCDHVAHRGARRAAVGGLFALMAYWGVVARLTFWDFGWDIMEPVTYLSGLSTVICGYLWFLYHNREVSYTSVLSQSVSTRREALYEKHGLRLEEWSDTKAMVKAIRKEIKSIAQEYDVEWDGSSDGERKSRRRTDESEGEKEEKREESKEDIFEPEETKDLEQDMERREEKSESKASKEVQEQEKKQ